MRTVVDQGRLPSDQSPYFSMEFVERVHAGKKRASTCVNRRVSWEEGRSASDEVLYDNQMITILLITCVEKRTHGSLDNEVVREESV